MTVRGFTASQMAVTRPCFLIIDREFPANLSTRKLVVESAKFNVLTAYSPEEAVETLRRFPAVDGIVMDAETEAIACKELIEQLRAVRKEVLIVTVSPGGNIRCDGEQASVDSHDPSGLVKTLQRFCPEESKAVEREDSELHRISDRWARATKIPTETD
jgi:CheY-like chemotaxis protein